MTEAIPSPNPSMPDVGTVVDGRYRIDALHAEGGMSTVFRATHLLLQRSVAFKVVTAEVMAVPGCAARFLREARAATQLRNDHIVQVFDVGVMDSGAPFMVMEWLEGTDLAQALEDKGPQPLETAIEYVLQVCETLAEVHGRGIIHRDLKPGNLFVTTGPDGGPRIKLLDFGVSKMAMTGGGDRITQTGTVLGSPSYMAPEQMGSAEAADERTDVWGVGVVLFELLTAQVPFEGETLAAILKAIATQGAPKVSAIRSEVPEGVDVVIARCLRADPVDRFQNVAELAAALAPFGAPGSLARADGIEAMFTAARLRPLDLTPTSTSGDELRHVSVKTPTPAPDESISPCVQSTGRTDLEELAAVEEVTRKNRKKNRRLGPVLGAALLLTIVGLGVGGALSRMGARGPDQLATGSQPEATVSVPRVSLANAVIPMPPATMAPASTPSTSGSTPSVPSVLPTTRPSPRVARWADLAPLAPTAPATTITPSPSHPMAPTREPAPHADELFEERK